jgi:multiphosphoryl transfer protein
VPPVVGLVVVAHSRALAEAAVTFAMEMAHGQSPRVVVAAGLEDGVFGTDALAIKDAVEEADDGAGVVILMDLGSAVFSSELALELIDPELRSRVHLTSAPLVEGLVAAVVQAASGESPEAIIAEAIAGLHAKQAHLDTAVEPSVPDVVDAADGQRATFAITNPHGLHARPAARLVAEVKRFDAVVTVRNLTTNTSFVPAASLSKVAAMGALQGHELEAVARGRQARRALDALVALAARSFDEQPAAVVAGSPGELHAETPLPAAPGIAIGAKWTIESDVLVPADDGDCDPHLEWQSLQRAISGTMRDISDTANRMRRSAGESDAAIFDAHAMLLEDNEILSEVEESIKAGHSAATAWTSALDAVEHHWAEVDDPYLNARAGDVRSVRNQVLRRLTGVNGQIVSRQGILVADDLTPNETAQLDTSVVSGIVTASGSPTSHTAILARALGLPAVVGAGRGVLEVADGTEMVIDGGQGTVLIEPPAAVVADYRSRADEAARAAAAARSRAQGSAMTTDGVVVEVAVNMSAASGIREVIEGGADSVGLVRTEFLFLDRTEPPSVDEQEAEYRRIADGIGELHLTIRTLDIGGDKPVDYIRLPSEANPFLGTRGIRLSLTEPDLLTAQLTAIARVARDHPLAVLFPMVTSVAELDQAFAMLDDVCRHEGVARDQIGVGMMVEVPAVAANAAAFAGRVDFLSIGTNDLTQYALAAERGNQAVAHLSDALDPGVLRLVKSVVDAAAADGTKVAVCGEVASDLAAVPVLIGLGVDELSVTPYAVPAVKDEVRRWSSSSAAALAAEVIELDSADAVRAAVAARTGQ